MHTWKKPYPRRFQWHGILEKAKVFRWQRSVAAKEFVGLWDGSLQCYDDWSVSCIFVQCLECTLQDDSYWLLITLMCHWCATAASSTVKNEASNRDMDNQESCVHGIMGMQELPVSFSQALYEPKTTPKVKPLKLRCLFFWYYKYVYIKEPACNTLTTALNKPICPQKDVWWPEQGRLCCSWRWNEGCGGTSEWDCKG